MAAENQLRQTSHQHITQGSNENVLMRNNNKWSPATVEDQHESPRPYILKDNTGRNFRINRKHIRPTKTQIQDTYQVNL